MSSHDNDRTFSITKDGLHPAVGDAYRYEDRDYRFWFYPEFKGVTTGGYDVVVHRASTERFVGSPPKIEPPNVATIVSNIRSYFEGTDLIGRPISRPEDRPQNISFTWALGQ